jgi:hypothetical protein
VAETTTRQTAGPLQLLESGTAGYCDPVSGLCSLPAAVPELHGDPETAILPDHAEKVIERESAAPPRP